MTTVHIGQAHTHRPATVSAHSGQSTGIDRTGMSLSTLPSPTAVPARLDAPILDVVVPVHNEEIDLEPCARRLHAYLAANFPYRFRVTIADNASTDSTADVARQLAGDLAGVVSVHLTEKGRGRALKYVWTRSDAAVLAYLDVDLSTDLGALLPLVAPLISGHSDLAIGSRLARGSRVVRGAKRELISRSYNLLLRGTLSARFSDAQCGFKAIRSEVATQLLPMVEDTGWFFDTEMLVLAERAGLRIHEVPVDWIDDPDSRVDIAATALADLKGIARLARALGTGRLPLAALREQLGRNPVAGVPAGLTGQLLRFAAVGVASTLAYLALYALLRLGIGPQWASALSA
jgi:Glycosyl transferase family 2